MNHEGDLTPPQPEPTPGAYPQQQPALSSSPSWLTRYTLAVLSGTGVVLVAAIAVAAVLAVAKPNPSIEKMVPATHDVLLIANLNPSLAQKVNLLRAVHSFPDTKTDAAISTKLDEAFKDTGLSFTNDVQSWLGGEVGVSGKLNFESSADSPFALFATSRDDTKAKAVLAKLRSGSFGKKYTWKDETYNGITITSGTPTATSVKPVAYSLVDHVVVAASSAAMIHEIIDTDQGRSARMVDSADFNATGRPDAVLRWIPKTSDGFLAFSNLDKSIKTLLDQYGSDASVKASADAVGLTGPQGILPHLTGDLGVEVELGNNSIPSGAILIGTNDPAAMNAFFGKLVGLAAATGQQKPGAGITRTTYRGTVITSWTSSSLGGPGLAPSTADLDGMGIVASSPAEMRAVIDAHAAGSNITANPTYQAASAASLSKPAGIVFVNLERVVSALEKLPTSSSIDTKTAAYLAPLKAFMLTATSQAGTAVERLFIAIK